MRTGPKRLFLARCKERGYALVDVMPCVVKQDGDQWTVDETHPAYPRRPNRHATNPSGATSAAIPAVAIARNGSRTAASGTGSDPAWLATENTYRQQHTVTAAAQASNQAVPAVRNTRLLDMIQPPIGSEQLESYHNSSPPFNPTYGERELPSGGKPSLIKRFTNWRMAIQRWKAAGKPERTDEDVEQINVICRTCDDYDEEWQQCKMCGCFCRKKGRAEFNKPKMATEACPIGKWGFEPMDVVYPLSTGRHGRKVLGSKWDDNELRYSLRSLETYFPRLGRVFVVTETLPEWLRGVEHVEVKDAHRTNKDANLIDKVLAACKAGVSETFLRLSDDQCLLRYWDGTDVWHMGEADGQHGGKWWRRCQHTCDYLKDRGRPTWFYDCHCPAPVNRREFIRIAEEAPYQDSPGMCINTLYFNSVDIPRERMNGQKVAVHRGIGPKKIQRLSAGKLFLGYSEAGTNKWLKRFLSKRFPRKSRFEK